MIQKSTEKDWIAGQANIYHSSYKATATTEFIIIIQSKRGNSNIIYNVSTMLREINKQFVQFGN